jgi:transposase
LDAAHAIWAVNRPRISRELLLRQEGQSKPIREIAWKAKLRLCARYRKLARTGKPANAVTGAIARELAGFVWAIARHVPNAELIESAARCMQGSASDPF